LAFSAVNAQDTCPKNDIEGDVNMSDICTAFQVLVIRIDTDSNLDPVNNICVDEEKRFLSEKLEFYIAEFAGSFFSTNDLHLNSPLLEIDLVDIDIGIDTLVSLTSNLFNDATAKDAIISLDLSKQDNTVNTLLDPVLNAAMVTESVPGLSPVALKGRSTAPPSVAPRIPFLSNLLFNNVVTKPPTSRPSNKPTNPPTLRPTLRPTNRPTLRPTAKLIMSSPMGLISSTQTAISGIPTVTRNRKLSKDYNTASPQHRKLAKGTYVWGGSSSWTCRSCGSDKSDYRRRSLQVDGERRDTLWENLEAFMMEKLTVAMMREVTLFVESSTVIGCLANGDSLRVHFQIINKDS
jgi:hypothetical protein